MCTHCIHLTNLCLVSRGKQRRTEKLIRNLASWGSESQEVKSVSSRQGQGQGRDRSRVLEPGPVVQMDKMWNY